VPGFLLVRLTKGFLVLLRELAELIARTHKNGSALAPRMGPTDIDPGDMTMMKVPDSASNKAPFVNRRTALVASAAGWWPPPRSPAPPSTEQAHQSSPAEVNKRLTRAYIKEVFNGHRPDLASMFLAPEVIWHGGTLGTVVGVTNVTGLLYSIIGRCPTWSRPRRTSSRRGDTVRSTSDGRGNPTGPLSWASRPPGGGVRWDAVDVFRFSNRKIVEEWAADDTTAILYQLGQYTPPWLAAR